MLSPYPCIYSKSFKLARKAPHAPRCKDQHGKGKGTARITLSTPAGFFRKGGKPLPYSEISKPLKRNRHGRHGAEKFALSSKHGMTP